MLPLLPQPRLRRQTTVVVVPGLLSARLAEQFHQYPQQLRVEGTNAIVLLPQLRLLLMMIVQLVREKGERMRYIISM